MKKILFSLLFLSSLSVFGQETWNTCSQTVTVIPQPSYDSTFVLSAPSRAALAKGMASWTASSSSSASYLVYTALLSQTGTDAPVATVLENTLGGTVVWSYNDVGYYTATLANAFTENKTYLPLVIINDGGPVVVSVSWASSSAIELNISSNGLLGATPFEIRVYP